MNTDELPERFVLQMPDSSLDPKIAKGTDLIFESAGTPEPGLVVLLQDSTGHRYVRRYAEGLAGTWEAQAINTSYATLQSERDGLVVLAVMAWVKAPRI